MADALDKVPVRLIGIRYGARDTLLLEFARPDGYPLPSVEPGAHIELVLGNGLVRQYSLIESGAALESYTVGVKRDPASRGGSAWIHDKCRVGDLIPISGPRNHFPLHLDAPHSVLIAGGIGITPIWCMAQRLIDLGQSWEIHYSARSRSDAAFLRTLQRHDCARFNFDEENGGQFLDLAALVAAAPPGSHFYCCGPQPMLAAFEKATAHLPPRQVHVEYFGAKEAAAAEGGFTVELASSGQCLAVAPGKTILQVLRDAGVAINFSCEQGTCGACETRVIAGRPDHRDALLSDEERAANTTMMVCCSGSLDDRLVLDL